METAPHQQTFVAHPLANLPLRLPPAFWQHSFSRASPSSAYRLFTGVVLAVTFLIKKKLARPLFS